MAVFLPPQVHQISIRGWHVIQGARCVASATGGVGVLVRVKKSAKECQQCYRKPNAFQSKMQGNDVPRARKCKTPAMNLTVFDDPSFSKKKTEMHLPLNTSFKGENTRCRHAIIF